MIYYFREFVVCIAVVWILDTIARYCYDMYTLYKARKVIRYAVDNGRAKRDFDTR